MKNRTLNLMGIRHFLYAVLVAVFIISCSNGKDVKTIIVCGKDTINHSANKDGKIYSIEEIANMKSGDIIYVIVCGDIRRGEVIRNDMEKEIIWYRRANYFSDINDFSEVVIKPWRELP